MKRVLFVVITALFFLVSVQTVSATVPNCNTLDFSTLSWSQVKSYVANNQHIDNGGRSYVDMPLKCAGKLSRALEFNGKTLSSLPVDWAYYKPSERLYVGITDIDLIKYKLRLNSKRNMTFNDNNGNMIFNVVSSTDIYQIDDIVLTREWGYHGSGFGTDYILAKSELIQVNENICLKNSKTGFSTYENCLKYPVSMITTWNGTNFTSNDAVNRNIIENKAIITYPLPYDPILAPTDSLVLYYPFNESGTTRPIDWGSDGADNDLELYSGTNFGNHQYVTGVGGSNALEIDGLIAYPNALRTGVDTNITLASGADWTVCVTTKPYDNGVERAITRDATSDKFNLWRRTNKKWMISKASGGSYATGNYIQEANETAHICFVFDNSQNTIVQYINGTLYHNITGITTEQTFTNQELRFGHRDFDNRDYYGTVQDYRAYLGKALTPQEINDTYNEDWNLSSGGCTPSWLNETVSNTCYINDSNTQVLNEYDTNACSGSSNTSFTLYTGCDNCTPSATNTTLTYNVTLSCLNTDLNNDSYYQTQYDGNNCFALTGLANDSYTNVTYLSYAQNVTCDFCTPNPTNTSFTYNQSACSIIDDYNKDGNATQYDSNTCFALTGLTADNYTNTTVWDNSTGITCNYCSYSLVYGSWNTYSLTTCGERNQTVNDGNFSLCCDVTNITSDCYLNDTQGTNFTYYEFENLTCAMATPSSTTTPINVSKRPYVAVFIVIATVFLIMGFSYYKEKGYTLSTELLTVAIMVFNVVIILLVGFGS